MGKRSIESFVNVIIDKWNLPESYTPKGNLVSSYQIMAIKSQDSSDPSIWDVKPDSDLINQISKLPNQKSWDGLLAKHGILHDPDRKHFVKIYSLDDVSNNKVLSNSFVSFRKTWVTVLKDESGWTKFLKLKRNIEASQLLPFIEPSPYLPLILGFVCCDCGSGFARCFGSDKPIYSLLTQHYEKVHLSLAVSDRIYLSCYIQQGNSNSFQSVKIGKSQLIELQEIDQKASGIFSNLIVNTFMLPYRKGINGSEYELVLKGLSKLIFGLADNLSITNILNPVLKKSLKVMEGNGTHEEIYKAIDKAKHEYKNYKNSDKLYQLTSLDLTSAFASYLGFIIQCYGYQKFINLQDKFVLTKKSDTTFECSFGNIKVNDFNVWIIFLMRIICSELDVFPANWPSWKSKEFRVLQGIKGLLGINVSLPKDFLTINKLNDLVKRGPPAGTLFTDKEFLLSFSRRTTLNDGNFRNSDNTNKNEISNKELANENVQKNGKVELSDGKISTTVVGNDSVFGNLLMNFKNHLSSDNRNWTPDAYSSLLLMVKRLVIYCTSKAIGENILKDIEPLGLDPGHYELTKFDCKINLFYSKYAAHFLYLLMVLQDQRISSTHCQSVDVFSLWKFVFDNGIETDDKDLSIAATAILVGWGIKGCFLSPPEARMVGYILASKVSKII